MLMDMSGTHDGEPWPPAGGTVDLPELQAEKLIAAGLAEKWRSHDKKEPEKPKGLTKAKVEAATLEPEVESADAPAVPPKRGPGRPRKVQP